ncbi:hypothetical protein [Bhargavaea cecembensis]|uniref:hypothetical protein n=1 Tax=Bhargavaea cecembensis TaxID=394098 RepID=UPI00267EC327
MVIYNVLDYSPIDEGSDGRQALLATTELANLAENWATGGSGYPNIIMCARLPAAVPKC